MLAWSAPIFAVWQSGCTTLTDSCEDFESQRVSRGVPFEADDGGPAGPPSTPEQCVQFCQMHLGIQNDLACHTTAADGGLIVVCEFNTTCEGRLPAGYEPPCDDTSTPLLGRYFARMAAGEAASVTAFQQLAEELEEHGAPLELVDGAERAAAEEGRHWRITAALARRYGARATRGTTPPRRQRPLFELALENVREGVVRETLGAAIGWWQAARAEERAVRTAMRRIANDESGHAELSWQLDVWVRERLSTVERAQLDAAREAAIATIGRELEAPVDGELVRRAGFPPPPVARALLAALREQIFC
jgi:hypothetical protein